MSRSNGCDWSINANILVKIEFIRRCYDENLIGKNSNFKHFYITLHIIIVEKDSSQRKKG
jgi:hypothetical protein